MSSQRLLIKMLVISLLLLSTVGCERLLGPSPEEVLNKYLDAHLKGRYEEAYSYVCAADKAVKSLEEYRTGNDLKDNPFAEMLVSNSSYKVLSVTETGKRASANVELTLPDVGVMFKDILGSAFASAFSGDTDREDLGKEIAKKYEKGNIPLTTKEQTFELVKEDGGWKVFLDWKTERMKKEKQAKIANLLGEARGLRSDKKLHGAREKYEQVLELDSEVVEAKKAIEEMDEEIEAFQEKQAYIKNVVLYDLKARYYKTYLEKTVPGVEFKLKNRGNRTLNKVQVTIYFKDSKGTVIAEEDFYPVLVSEYSFRGDNKPLKPNYIWQLEQGKFYKADSVPSEWKEGAVSARITNIEFAE